MIRKLLTSATTAFLLSHGPAIAEELGGVAQPSQEQAPENREIIGSLIPPERVGITLTPERMLDFAHQHNLDPLLTTDTMDQESQNLGNFVIFANDEGDWQLFTRQKHEPDALFPVKRYELTRFGDAYELNTGLAQSIEAGLTEDTKHCNNLGYLFDQEDFDITFSGRDTSLGENVNAVYILSERLHNGGDFEREGQYHYLATRFFPWEDCQNAGWIGHINYAIRGDRKDNTAHLTP